MQFNNTSIQEKSLYHDAVTLVGITDTAQFPIIEFTRYANNRYREADSLIWQHTGTWEYDDSNYANFPIATKDIVADRQDYEIPSVARKIDRAEVLDVNGDYQLLYPMDKSQIGEQSMTEFLSTSGLPRYYDVIARSLFLYPAPSASDVTTSEGIKLYFTRDIDEFAITDTSTEPGFDNHFHRLISLGSAYDYCMAHGVQGRLNPIKEEMNVLKSQMTDFYGMRHRDMQPKIIPRDNNCI